MTPSWFDTPPGQYLLSWECRRYDAAVADVFGYHSLQLGLPVLDTLLVNRMPHRWLAVDTVGPHLHLMPPPVALVTDFAALPFAAASLDLVTMPHTLELADDPHATLREVERVLVPQGRVVLSGLNPASLWGLVQWGAQLHQRLGAADLPYPGELLGYWRLRDWLRLLGFELESVHFGCYRPAVGSDIWLERYAWLEGPGRRWWPILGAVYFIVATKRVPGMRLLSPGWRKVRSRANAPASVANRVERLEG